MNSKKKRNNQNKFKLNQASELQSISSFSCTTDSNSSSSTMQSLFKQNKQCDDNLSSSEQTPTTNEQQNENDSEEIDYSDEPNLSYFESNNNKMPDDTLYKSELMDSFLLKEENR